MVLEYFVKTTLLPNLEGRLGDKSGRDRCWLQIIVHSLQLKSPISSNLDCAYELLSPLSEIQKEPMSSDDGNEMAANRYLPHGRVLMDGTALIFDRLRSKSKMAVSVPVLRAIIFVSISELPFEPEFYLNTYPDIRQAYEAGEITDLKTHFINSGYFEGRLGAEPAFDEQFYKSTYPDIVKALETGKTSLAFEHHVRAGAFEDRHANALNQENAKHWTKAFQPGDAPQGSGSRR